jgi:hypothetical protein
VAGTAIHFRINDPFNNLSYSSRLILADRQILVWPLPSFGGNEPVQDVCHCAADVPPAAALAPHTRTISVISTPEFA